VTGEPVPRPHPEVVVLDIGGPLGALVVYAGLDLLDTQIELSLAGNHGNRVHQHILERPLPTRTAYAAVFDKVEQGAYTLWMDGRARVREVTVEGGSVTEVDWTAGVD
jgi:hypothetical protein